MENHNSAITSHLLTELKGALADEHIYQPYLQLPTVAENKTDITCGMRDGSAHVLRCLKVWFDLPSEVLLLATYNMDRFLSKMKALRKHLACIAVSALHLAADTLMPEQSPALTQLATISQCGCTDGDLARMSALIEEKLGPGVPTTPAHYLSLFIKIAGQQGIIIPNEDKLIQKMEILACDASCSSFRPCELALVLLCIHMQELNSLMVRDQLRKLAQVAAQLQQLCQIGEKNLWCCHNVVLHTFEQYNGQSRVPYKQRLVWRLSQRTRRYMTPSSELICYLPTIEENSLLQLNNDRKRSQSLSSEDSFEHEEEDVTWSCESEGTKDKWNLYKLEEGEEQKIYN